MQSFDQGVTLRRDSPPSPPYGSIFDQQMYVYRDLPSLPPSSQSSRLTVRGQAQRYQETSLVLSRSKSTPPDCAGTWPAAAAAAAASTYSRVDQAVTDYTPVWIDRSRATSQSLSPSHSSSDQYNNLGETPDAAVSSASVSLRTTRRSQYAPLNFDDARRDGTPSSVATGYIRNFNFVNSP